MFLSFYFSIDKLSLTSSIQSNDSTVYTHILLAKIKHTNDQESELDMLMSNELPEGEKQIKISSYCLFVSCQSMMKITETQRKKFIGLCEYLLRKGIIMADHYPTFPMITFQFNKDKMKALDFYCLMANIHTKYFFIKLSDFVRIGINLFNIRSKTAESLYNELNKQQQSEVPEEIKEFT
mgnify:CR=1 FL=1